MELIGNVEPNSHTRKYKGIEVIFTFTKAGGELCIFVSGLIPWTEVGNWENAKELIDNTLNTLK